MKRPNPIDHRPKAIRTIPAQKGILEDNPANQSSPRLAGVKSTATTRGRDRAKPNMLSEINPFIIAPPDAPLAAAVPRSANINGAAQTGMLKANKKPRPAEPPCRKIGTGGVQVIPKES